MLYGYVRVSQKSQNIERQINNIIHEYPNAIMFKDIHTGTTINGREEFNKMLSIVQSGDTIVFDSVSTMSQNADEGLKIYKQLYNKGVELIFLKESYVNTSVYKDTLNDFITSFINPILEHVNKYATSVAMTQVSQAFHQAEKEVLDTRQRTKEGLREAKKKGKRVGRVKGETVTTQKGIEIKKFIQQYCKNFNGSLNDIDTMSLIKSKLGKLSQNTYYKYKRELKEHLNT